MHRNSDFPEEIVKGRDAEREREKHRCEAKDTGWRQVQTHRKSQAGRTRGRG